MVGENISSAGVYNLSTALFISEEKGLDLVEISPKTDPPICKIVDYKKFLYQQKKRKKELKAKSQKVSVKEIRFGPQTDTHDFEFKLKHAKKFLEDGNKVRAFVFFKGRTIMFKDQGELILFKFLDELKDLGKVEQLPKLEGKRMFTIIAPQKKT